MNMLDESERLNRLVEIRATRGNDSKVAIDDLMAEKPRRVKRNTSYPTN